MINRKLVSCHECKSILRAEWNGILCKIKSTKVIEFVDNHRCPSFEKRKGR